MPQNGLQLLSLNTRELITRAIESGNHQQALNIGKKLPKDYTLFFNGIQNILSAFIIWTGPQFSIHQSQMAAEITAKINAHDDQGAKELLLKKFRHHVVFHDLYVDFAAKLQDSILKEYGVEALERSLIDVAVALKDSLLKPWAVLPGRKRFEALCYTMKNHQSKISLSEDPEKFTMIMDPCGTGGWLLRTGRYKGENALTIIKERKLMTGYRENFPNYCTHCIIWMDIVARVLFDHHIAIFEPPEKPEDVCKMLVYKEEVDVPTEKIINIPQDIFDYIVKHKKEDIETQIWV